jgi:hypothetical protein
MKKLFIHIGMPKTGTSYLQSNFAFNEDNYKHHGLLYPDLSLNHRYAVHGFTSGNGLLLAKKIIPALNRHKSDFNEKDFFTNLDPSYDYLISCEWLVEMTTEDIHRINSLCGGTHHIHLLVFYRSFSDQIVSLALQDIKNTHTFTKPSLQLIEDRKEVIRRITNNVISLCKQYPAHSVLRYELADHNLDKLDQIFFDFEHVTKRIDLKSVNLSPNMHQISVIELAHKLDISAFELNIKYIDSTYNSKYPKYGLSKEQANDIEQSFNNEITALNQLADASNQYQRYSSYNLNKPYESIDINDEDISYLKKLIKHYSLQQIEPLFDFLLEVYNDQLNQGKALPELPEDFDPVKYLLCNHDLIFRRVDPKTHFIAQGEKEDRRYK